MLRKIAIVIGGLLIAGALIGFSVFIARIYAEAAHDVVNDASLPFFRH